MNSILKAFLIAFKVHKGQKDLSGKPYILHPLYVSLHCQGKNEKIVGLLHDVIEDSDMGVWELRKDFDDEIIKAVDALTRKPYVEYDDYIEVVAENELAKSVKIQDLKHNMMENRIKNPTEKDIKRREKYQRAYRYLTK